MMQLEPAKNRFTSQFPLFLSQISAGFPSPAESYLEEMIDLNKKYIKHPSATFFAKVNGNSMTGVGIFDGDVLIIDRSIKPVDNQIVVAILNEEFTVKRFRRRQDKTFLVPENPNYSPIEITSEMQFEIWGVVVHCIHSF